MRRPNGSGTIAKLSGARRRPYVVRISVRDKKGKIVQKNLSYHATQKEAFAALDEYQRKRAAGLAPSPDDLGVTLQTVYDLWSVRKFEGAGASSITSYKASWRRVARYATVPVRELGIDQWQAIIDDDKRNGLSKSSINNDVILIRALSSFAMERDWIVKDYSQFIQIPQVEAKFKKGAFTPDEVKALSQMAASGTAGADAVLV